MLLSTNAPTTDKDKHNGSFIIPKGFPFDTPPRKLEVRTRAAALLKSCLRGTQAMINMR